jgi:hypothetical protein
MKVGCLLLVILVLFANLLIQLGRDQPKLKQSGVVGDSPPACGKWSIRFQKSAFDDSRTVILHLVADSPVRGWLKLETPTLVLRCLEGKTHAYIDVGMAAQPELGEHNHATIRLRFDAAPAVKRRALESTDQTALFISDPIPFIRSLLKHRTLVFGFTPFNAPPAETQFDLAGLAAVIGPLRETCSW